MATLEGARAMDVGGSDTRENSRLAAAADACMTLSRRSLACQSMNPGAKKLTACAEHIEAYKQCKEEMVAAARTKRGEQR
jgi:hypothetical protein